MTVTVRLPTQLRDATGGDGEVTVPVDGGSVQSVIDALFEAHGELRSRLTGEDGELRRFVNVYVDGEVTGSIGPGLCVLLGVGPDERRLRRAGVAVRKA